MEKERSDIEAFSENQSLQVIRDMIEVSRNKLYKDSIMIIVWGWIMTLGYLLMYLVRTTPMTYGVSRFINLTGNLLPIAGILFSGYYIFMQRRKVRTYIGTSLRYVWVAMVCCLMLTNMILFNNLHELNLQLQHPIFMVFIAYSIVVTGVILKYNLLIVGGILFGAAAYMASRYTLDVQLLIESALWFIAFVIPGHILYSRRKK